MAKVTGIKDTSLSLIGMYVISWISDLVVVLVCFQVKGSW